MRATLQLFKSGEIRSDGQMLDRKALKQIAKDHPEWRLVQAIDGELVIYADLEMGAGMVYGKPAIEKAIVSLTRLVDAAP